MSHDIVVSYDHVTSDAVRYDHVTSDAVVRYDHVTSDAAVRYDHVTSGVVVSHDVATTLTDDSKLLSCSFHELQELANSLMMTTFGTSDNMFTTMLHQK